MKVSPNYHTLEISPEPTIGVSLRWIKGRYAWKADGLTAFIRSPILLLEVISYGSDHPPVSTVLYPRRLGRLLVGLA